VNLLSDIRSHIVPEFIPWYGSNEPVANCALQLLHDPERLRAQRERLRHLVQALDQPGASMNAAKLAIEMLTSEQKTVLVAEP
jgi:lipid A disaccharide synthetase